MPIVLNTPHSKCAAGTLPGCYICLSNLHLQDGVSKEEVRNLNELLGASVCAVGNVPACTDTLAAGG